MSEINTAAELAAAALEVKHEEGNPFVILPPDYKVHDLEKMLANPLRKRGTVTMNDAASFIDFFNTHKTAGQSRIYGQVDPPLFVGVLNDHIGELGGWQDHRVSYACPLSAEWNTWLKSSGRQMTQLDFANFIETNVIDIRGDAEKGEPTGTDMLQISTSFKVQKNVNFSSGQVLHNGQVQFQYVEDVNGAAGSKGEIRVPERFFIGVPVFEGGEPYKVEAKLRWRLKDGTLTMWYELVRPHKVLEAAFMGVWQNIATDTDMNIWRGMLK